MPEDLPANHRRRGGFLSGLLIGVTTAALACYLFWFLAPNAFNDDDRVPILSVAVPGSLLGQADGAQLYVGVADGWKTDEVVALLGTKYPHITFKPLAISPESACCQDNYMVLTLKAQPYPHIASVGVRTAGSVESVVVVKIGGRWRVLLRKTSYM